LDAECIDASWPDIREGIRSGPVLYLFFAAAHRGVANVEKVPATDACELEDNPVSGLIGSVETGTVGGATLRVVLKATALCEREARAQNG
jgi:hypothetical protein